MAVIKLKKNSSELERKLFNKIKQLKYEIITQPAYPRKKNDVENRKIFDAIFIIAGLAGIIIFGAAWFAVALLGTVLSIFIVETGLLLSLSMCLGGGFFHRIYIGVRDLFSSEKIKNQNKDYDNLKKDLTYLEELFLEKTFLSKEINTQLGYVIQLTFVIQKNTDFLRISLKEQIEQLEQKKKNHPACVRKMKDKANWQKLFRLSNLISFMSVNIYFIGFIFIGAPLTSTLLISSIVPVILVAESILILILIMPIVINSLVYAVYLFIRDTLSAHEIKTENKEYDQLEKIIDKLKALSKQQVTLDRFIEGKLQEPDTDSVEKTQDSLSSENQSSARSLASNDKHKNYGPLFKVPYIAEDNALPTYSMDFHNSI